MTDDDVSSSGSWRRKLLRRISRAVNDPQQAEDYLHSAFLRLEEYRAEHTVRNPEAFLMRAAVNLAVDESRRRRVRNEAGPSLGEMFKLAEDRPLQNEVLAARERLRRVQACLDGLNPRTREIFLMHRLDGKKYRDIAAELGISVSAVEKHIAKAVLALTQWTEGW